MFRTSSSEARSNSKKNLCTYSARESQKGLPTHAKSPQRPALDLQHRPDGSGSPTMPQGGSAGPNMISISPMGSLVQAHLRRPQRTPTTCDSHSASSMPAATQRLVRTTWEAVAASRSRRRRRERKTTPTNGRLQGRPRRCASAPPRARTGHPILATCEARDRAPRVPIGQASVARRIRRGRLRAVLDPLREAPSRLKF